MSDRCVACGRPLQPKAGKTYVLTPEERRLLEAMGQPEDPSYCLACDRVMRDPRLAAEFMRGIWLAKYRAAGVPVAIAEERTKKLFDFMVFRATQHQKKS